MKNGIARRGPGYQALAEQLRQEILTGSLKVGDRLPTFMELHERHGVARGTVDKALSLLDSEGLIDRCQGSGVYVSAPEPVLAPRRIGFNFPAPEGGRHDPYWAHLIEGIRSGAAEQGLELGVLANDAPAPQRQLSGAIIVSHDPIKARIEYPRNFPCVYLLVPVEGRNSVVVDDYGGAWRAVELLLSKGHRRIGFLVSEGHIVAHRVDGYRDALIQSGIEFQESWLHYLPDHALDDGHAVGGRVGMTAWLEEGWRELECTGLLVFNDSVAIGAIQALRAAGIAVPDEVSVVGFDGTEICQHVYPPLTSVRIPLEEVGRAAVKMLSGLLENQTGRPPAPQILTLPVDMAEGGTVADIRLSASAEPQL